MVHFGIKLVARNSLCLPQPERRRGLNYILESAQVDGFPFLCNVQQHWQTGRQFAIGGGVLAVFSWLGARGGSQRSGTGHRAPAGPEDPPHEGAAAGEGRVHGGLRGGAAQLPDRQALHPVHKAGPPAWAS